MFITDIHNHVLFDIDDGSYDIDMSIEMLKMATHQGVDKVFCTSHSWGDLENYWNNFHKLKQRISDENLSINIYSGCEIYCEVSEIELIAQDINDGNIPTLNQTQYILIEFSTEETCENIVYMFNKLKQLTSKSIIIAHIERYKNLYNDLQTIEYLHNSGVYFQVNIYSLVNESRNQIKEFARKLLNLKYIAFIGSDSHTINHRPPKIDDGIKYIVENCESSYMLDICYKNAEKMLIKGEVL